MTAYSESWSFTHLYRDELALAHAHRDTGSGSRTALLLKMLSQGPGCGIRQHWVLLQVLGQPYNERFAIRAGWHHTSNARVHVDFIFCGASTQRPTRYSNTRPNTLGGLVGGSLSAPADCYESASSCCWAASSWVRSSAICARSSSKGTTSSLSSRLLSFRLTTARGSASFVSPEDAV